MFNLLLEMIKYHLNKLSLINLLSFVFTMLFILSCVNEKDESIKEKPTIILKKNKIVSKSDTAYRAAPIINIVDTVSLPFNVISIKDSASNNFRLSQKLGIIYAEKLTECIKKNKLKITGPPLAWYKTQKAPFFFEAGFPVDKKPAKLTKSINFKRIPRSKVILAHYFGPYEETVQAYESLKDWIKGNNKSLTAPAYEIYVTDPIDKDGNAVDPYKVQTDIVFPYH